jgi:hypothetical protein
MLHHPNEMICSSFYWQFPGIKPVIVHKLRATILSHVFNSSFPYSVTDTPRAFCPMASFLASFQSSVYLFVFHRKECGSEKSRRKKVYPASLLLRIDCGGQSS